MVEHHVRNVGVAGSTPAGSTNARVWDCAFWRLKGQGDEVKYVVRSLDGGWMADEGGLKRFDSVEEAKMAGVGAGVSFRVLEGEGVMREVAAGLKTQSGFFFSGGVADMVCARTVTGAESPGSVSGATAAT